MLPFFLHSVFCDLQGHTLTPTSGPPIPPLDQCLYPALIPGLSQLWSVGLVPQAFASPEAAWVEAEDQSLLPTLAEMCRICVR